MEKYIAVYNQMIGVKKALAELPEGTYTPARKNKSAHLTFRRLCKRRTKVLDLEHEQIVEPLCEKRKYLEAQLRNLQQQLNDIEDDYCSRNLDPFALLLDSYKARQQMLLKNKQQITVAEVASNDSFGGKKHVTIDGVYVRSKSEALFANLLIANQVSYLYENPLQLHDRLVFPDFTIRLPDRTIIIEYVGMTDDEEYMKNWWSKHQSYIESGYRENVDLICVYEYGGFNSQMVQRIIEAFILPYLC